MSKYDTTTTSLLEILNSFLSSHSFSFFLFRLLKIYIAQFIKLISHISMEMNEWVNAVSCFVVIVKRRHMNIINLHEFSRCFDILIDDASPSIHSFHPFIQLCEKIIFCNLKLVVEIDAFNGFYDSFASSIKKSKENAEIWWWKSGKSEFLDTEKKTAKLEERSRNCCSMESHSMRDSFFSKTYQISISFFCY